MDDKYYLERCVDLAKSIKDKGLDILVASIIVYEDRIISKGFKRFSNGKIVHAEVDAIKKSEEMCEGAVLYTTLEPCIYIPHLEERGLIKRKGIDHKIVHSIKYSSCTDYIINSGIIKLVVGIVDPNPWINGESLRILSNRGIEVKVIDDFREEIISLNPNYFNRRILPKDGS